MSFLKENGTAAILLAAIFMSLGFMLGKCCSHRGCHKGAQKSCHKSHGDHKCDHKSHSECSVWVSEDSEHGHGDEMIIVKSLMADGFEGDTILNIPGGEIVIAIHDGEVNVEVEIEEHEEHGEHESHEGHDHE
jgi:hypothetical protein